MRRSLAGGPSPRPIELARFDFTSNRPGIGRAAWLDGRTIAFLAEGRGEVAQLHTVDVETRTVARLTDHPTAVVDFDLEGGSDRFVYAAVTPFDWSDRIARGYVVGTETLVEVMGKGRVQLPAPVAYFVGDRRDRSRKPVAIAAYRLPSEAHPYGLWLAPDGRHAVALGYVPDAPEAWWTQYQPVARVDYLKGAKENAHFAASHPAIFMQYMLVDLRSGEARPLMQAPAAYLFAGIDTAAHWTGPGTVVLSNTFLPLSGVTGEALARRRAAAFAVEVDIASGALTPVTALDAAATRQRGGFLGSRLAGDGRLTVDWMGGPPTAYEKRGGAWTEVPSAPAKADLVLKVVQGLDQPPEVQASEGDVRRTITDLNPRLRGLAMGKVEPIEVTNALGHKVSGGLIRPAAYQPGRRYPLVIQLHGYDPNEFLVDGPSGSTAGYAARALASRGMVVVQLANTPSGQAGFRGELEPQVATLRALIDKLDREGLIDRDRVGIHGHSRTGYYVQHALTFSDLKFAAASVADPSQLSIYKHATFFGHSYPGMLEDERMIGVDPWGAANAKTWVERDPSFNLDRVKTPLRIEVYQYGLGWWDVYAMLRRHRRPVEYLSFPDAVHVPVKPWERQTSQEGTVDWYDFWLNRHEDPDPAKAEQYRRWRELRRQHEAALAEPPRASPSGS